MKTASVADLRNRFASVAGWLAKGEQVQITKRGKPFAILSPSRVERIPEPWPDLEARIRKIYPRPTKGKSIADLVSEGRGDY